MEKFLMNIEYMLSFLNESPAFEDKLTPAQHSLLTEVQNLLLKLIDEV